MTVIASTRGNSQASELAVQDALPLVGTASREDGQTTLNTIDADLARIYEDRNYTLSQGGTITFTGTTVTFSEGLKLHLNSKVAGGTPTIIDLGSTTRTIDNDGDMIYATLNRSAGTAVVTDDATTLPSVVSANKEVVLIAKRVDTGTGTKRVYFMDGSVLEENDSARLGTIMTDTIKGRTFSNFKYDEANVAIATNSIVMDSATVMRITSGTGPLNTITGAADGQVKILVNELGSSLTIANDSAADGFLTGTGQDLLLSDDAALTLVYEATAQRWNIIGGAGGGGGLTLTNISSGGPLNPNNHYLVDSSGGAFTTPLPAGAVGTVIRLSDITDSWGTNNVTVNPDGAETIDGDTTLILDVSGVWVQLMWDGTEWKTDDSLVPEALDLTGDLNVLGTLNASKGLITTDNSSGSVTVDAGETLQHPNLTIDAGDIYTINGSGIVEGGMTIDGTLELNGLLEGVTLNETNPTFTSVTADSIVSDSINTYWQEKTISTNITTIVDFLEFTTIVGKTYKYSGTLLIDLDASGDDDVLFEIKEGSTIKRYLNFVDRDTTVERRGSISFTYLFTAVDTSVKLRPNNLGAGASITANFGAGLHATWATLERLPNHIQI